MRLLLDTHVLIWWDEGARLSRVVREAIQDADQVFVSAAGGRSRSRRRLGRLKPRRTVSDAIEDSGFEELPLRLRLAEVLATLPPHHRDLFDRMLVAQALSDGLTVVTRDAAFDAYDAPRVRA